MNPNWLPHPDKLSHRVQKAIAEAEERWDRGKSAVAHPDENVRLEWLARAALKTVAEHMGIDQLSAALNDISSASRELPPARREAAAASVLRASSALDELTHYQTHPADRHGGDEDLREDPPTTS